jgi:hypothetical protein
MPTWENVKDLTPEVPWPSKYIKILQEKMLGDNIEVSTPLCNSCWEPENAGLDSHRLRYHRALKVLNDDLITNPKLTFLDLQFGYLCNLSCIMCHPEESSQIQKTIFKLIDTLKGLTDLQLNQVVAEVLNSYREKTSVMGYRISTVTDTFEYRNILV